MSRRRSEEWKGGGGGGRVGVYLALDDVIILVDLQVVARVAGDGAAVPVVEVAPGAAASELCIADQRLLAVDGFARVVHAASRGARVVWTEEGRKKGRSGRGRRKGRQGERTTIRVNDDTIQTVCPADDRSRLSTRQRLLYILNQ